MSDSVRPDAVNVSLRERELINALRDDLREIGVSVEHIDAWLGPVAAAAWERGSLAPMRLRLAQPRDGATQDSAALRTYVALFLCTDAVPSEEVDAAFPRCGAAGLAELGFTQVVARGQVQALVSLSPITIDDSTSSEALEWIIVSDLEDHQRQTPVRADHVMGVGGATRSLIALLPKAPVASACDIGTGSGIVALHLAQRAQRVVATDMMPRAARFAAINTLLNGLEERIEVRRGDRFAPVEGERFDLVASNPPFVVTPRGNTDQGAGEPLTYRDGGLEGDALMASMVRGIGRHLVPGGRAMLLANWEVQQEEAEAKATGTRSPIGSRVREWVSDASEVETAWLIERERLDPAEYAELWARDGGESRGSAGFELAVAQWVDDFARREVGAIGMGALLLRAGNQPLLWRAEARSEPYAPALDLAPRSLAESMHTAWDAGCWAARAGDEVILDTHWVRDTFAEEHRAYRPGAEEPRAMSIRTNAPFVRSILLDSALAAALGVCDGELSLRAISAAIAELYELPVDPLEGALATAIRDLAWAGVVMPEARLEQ